MDFLSVLFVVLAVTVGSYIDMKQIHTLHERIEKLEKKINSEENNEV